MKKAWGAGFRATPVLLALALPVASFAGVLAEDRADVLYHRYDGGGVTIHGPSVLVRKKLAEKYAISANYYMDMVTSASIDVEVSGASEYKESRDQYSLGLEYLRGKTTYNLGYTNSKENDYQAETTSFGIAQDLFGDLTTITMGFSRGKDVVRRRRHSGDRARRRDLPRARPRKRPWATPAPTVLAWPRARHPMPFSFGHLHQLQPQPPPALPSAPRAPSRASYTWSR